MPTFIVENSSDVVPIGTTHIEVVNKNIRRLPYLPASLTELVCYGCTSLSELPPLSHCVGLTRLICSECTSLRELPPLPTGLTELRCSYCTSLDDLPPLSHCASLTELRCSGCTSLRELPPFPKSLTKLYCYDYTSLLYLPTIPHTCKYYGISLPTKEKYFEQVNMGKNQEFVASRGDELLYGIIGKDITFIVKEYLF
jgi:hypothetical protein